MKSTTEGAWIVHHAKKLQKVVDISSFDDINTAGKCGVLLSTLTSDVQREISMVKVKAIAMSAGITTLELRSILDTLKKSFLIDTTSTSVSVLGLTNSSVLKHTSQIFNTSQPSDFEKAALEISEFVSNKPIEESILKEYVGDTRELPKRQVDELFLQLEEIGFIDTERIDTNSEKLVFNGNLFRKDQVKKSKAILDSLSSEESKKLNEFDEILTRKGCVSIDEAKRQLGGQLLSKFHSIGMFDFNKVANDSEEVIFITKPSAFNKFGNPFEDDALDLAKAFVSSLMYGMNYSASSRGKISRLEALMNQLIKGYMIGSSTAIGQDYRILEFKGVVEILPDTNPGKNGRFFMRLLKKEIGELALKVLQLGDSASEEGVLNFDGKSVSTYDGPETTRVEERMKKKTRENKIQIFEALNTLRLT